MDQEPICPPLALGETISQQLGLFVDTQNLYYSAKDYFSAHLHYGRLLECALRGRQLHQANAYVVARDHPAHGFISKLSHFGYRLHLRQVAIHHQDNGNIILEGDWDMGIAMDIMRALPIFRSLP
ncbi:MAG: NYN domain-containing protein [Deinococcales bacterium]